MSALLDKSSITWRPSIVVSKFSPDQCAYADRRVEDRVSWLNWRLIHRQMRSKAGSFYQKALAESLFATGEPEQGVAEDEGNLLTTAGLTAITALLVGAGGVNGKYSLNPTGNTGSTPNGGTGVGNVSTAATVSDVHLGGDGTSGNAWYQQNDATFPTVSAGVLTGQCTFASASANFAWNEWCWISGTGAGATSGAGVYTLASFWGTVASFAMWNHKIPAGGLGTKASGAAWVFSTTITLS